MFSNTDWMADSMAGMQVEGYTALRVRGLAALAKALADPTRLRVVDALRKASPEAVCQCELLPLFDISQPALAKHLKVLMAAGVVSCERRGLWKHYFLLPEALGDLYAWLG